MASEAGSRSAQIAVGARASKWQARVREVLKRPLLVIAIVLIVFLAFVATIGPSLSPYGSEELAAARFESPSGTHWLGTDELGRDVLTRVVAGSRLSLSIGIVASIVGVSLGGLIGAVTGYWGGKLDLLVQRSIDALQAFPVIILALAIVAVLGSSPRTIMMAAVIAFIPGSTRVIRSAVLETKERDFVTAAVTIGAGDLRILFRHVIPQAMAPYFVLISLFVGVAILLESGLSFLGVGPPPPAVSWGKMLGGEARIYIESAPWALLAPAFALTLVVYAFNLLGDSLRDMLDPRLRGT